MYCLPRGGVRLGSDGSYFIKLDGKTKKKQRGRLCKDAQNHGGRSERVRERVGCRKAFLIFFFWLFPFCSSRHWAIGWCVCVCRYRRRRREDHGVPPSFSLLSCYSVLSLRWTWMDGWEELFIFEVGLRKDGRTTTQTKKKNISKMCRDRVSQRVFRPLPSMGNRSCVRLATAPLCIEETPHSICQQSKAL